MNTLLVVKTVAGLVTSMSVGTVVNQAVKAVTPQAAGILTKVGCGIGGFVIGSVVAQKCVEYVDEQIDDIFGKYSR